MDLTLVIGQAIMLSVGGFLFGLGFWGARRIFFKS